MTIDEQNKMFEKILLGLEKAYKKLIEDKKRNNSELVILKDNKIVKVKPE